MRFHRYPETDSLVIELSERAGKDSIEVAPGVVLDFDGEGHPVGTVLDPAGNVATLNRLEAESVPVTALVLA